MSENDFSTPVLDEWEQDLSIEDLWSNQRIAVRYKRQDIQAVVKFRHLFWLRELPVILHDISSKGAAILSPYKLALNKALKLCLQFDDGMRFEIDAVITYSGGEQKYGLKFAHYQQTLADHLLQTQTDLDFS